MVILARVGVDYLSILDTYETLNRFENKSFVSENNDERSRRQMQAIIELLRHWVVSARSAVRDNKALQELSRAVTSGKLMPKIDSFRGKLETHSNTAALQESVRAIIHEIQNLV